MAFPQVPLGVDAQMYLGGTWVNITSDIYARDGVQIKRGYSSEGAASEPSSCTMTLNNRLGKYSPRNPVGPYYGQIGRNTPIRVGIEPRHGLAIPGEFQHQEYASTPDSVATSITGDIDIRIDLEIQGGSTWYEDDSYLVSKYTVADPGWAFAVAGAGIGTGGHLYFEWFTSTPTQVAALSTVPMTGPASGRRALRVILDVDNGASGNTVTFYTASTIAGPWTQLGAPIVQAGVTNLRDTAVPTVVGALPDGITISRKVIYSAEVRSGIAGTVVASPNFAAKTAGTTSFADTQGNTWTMNTPYAYIGDQTTTRFVGEVSSFPPKWDVSGNDAWVPIEAAGISRRLGQGSAPVQSALRRYIPATIVTAAYWPLEEGAQATAGLALNPAVAPMMFAQETGVTPPAGSITWAASTDLPSSLQAPDLENGGRLIATVDPGTVTAIAWSVTWCQKVSKDAGAQNFFYMDPGGYNFQMTIYTDGTVELYLGPTLLWTYAFNGPAFYDKVWHQFCLNVNQFGVNLVGTMYVDGFFMGSGNALAGNSNTSLRSAMFVAPNSTSAPMSVAHVAVFSGILGPTQISGLAGAFSAHRGEYAAGRMFRLCAEEDVPFEYVGDGVSEFVGPQRVAPFLSLLTDAATADLGLFFDTLDVLGVSYIPRKELYNRPPRLTLSYVGNQLAPPFEPVDDDQLTRNNVTVTRVEGGTAQVSQTIGPLADVSPLDGGVGRYDTSATLNVYADYQLADIAGWMVHLGTVDEARYPRVVVNRASNEVSSNTALSDSVLSADIGRRIVITGAASAGIYDDISLLVRGYTETLNAFEHRLEFVCVPESAYQVLEVDDGDLARADTDTSELVTLVSSSATALRVADSPGPGWTTAAGDMPIPIMVGGEAMSVTAVSAIAPAFVAAGASATGNNASVTPAHPAGLAVGDLKLIFATIRNSGTGRVNTAALVALGWEILVEFENIALLGKIHVSGDTAPLVTFLGGAAGADTIASMAAFRNVSPAVIRSATSLNASAQNIFCPAIAVPSVGVVLFLGWKQDDWTSIATPAGSSLIAATATATGSDAALAWYYQLNSVPMLSAGGGSLVVTGGAAAISRGITVALGFTQTFTVTRSVNGVAKSQIAGTKVELARRATIAL